ncbi:MAG TPA: AAA family ATPase [Gaiellaceae bacterium]
MQAAERPIVGRRRELDAGERLLDAPADRLAGLWIEGEPGIGKTTVWQAVVDRARATGLLALVCRPAEAETDLAFASLADVLEPVADDRLPRLPEPQRRALEVALLRTAPGAVAPDRRAVATAAWSLLLRCSEEGPLLVAVDDAQWLDAASASALAFALRRLERRPVRVLLATRSGAVSPVAASVADHLERLRLDGMSLSALYHVVRDRLGVVFPRPTLLRIAETSGGNPMFALELARALAEIGARPGPGEPLPVPVTLSGLVDERIRRLPARTRETLVAAAALSRPTREQIVAGLGVDAASALADAETRGILAEHDGRIEFTHPLLASAVYASAPAAKRRELHARLAAAAADPEERARHAALATAGPDEGVAAQLEQAARHADARGAPEVAADLALLAHRLTPDDESGGAADRALAVAEFSYRAGDTAESERRVRGLVATIDDPRRRAQARELLARIIHTTGTSREAAEQCVLALDEVGDDRALAARVHATLSRVTFFDFDLARRHGDRALELVDELDDPDPALVLHALIARMGGFYAGEPLRRDLVDRALELERLAPPPSVADRFTSALAVWLKNEGELAESRRLFAAAHAAVLEEGDEGSLPFVFSHLPQLELWSGDWVEAERAAQRHLEAAERTAQPSQRRQALYNLALVEAHLGRPDARSHAEALVEEALEAHDDWDAANGYAALGFLELSETRAAAAVDALRLCTALNEEMGRTEPVRSQVDFVESLVEMRLLDEAANACATLTERASATPRPPMVPLAARSRAIVAAARGDLEAARRELDAALALHERTPIPFDLARTLLVSGHVHRRSGERRRARDAFGRAEEILVRLGAASWAERAAAEAARIPIRRAAPSELTPTEERVATLVAAGRTNREAAQELFLSPKTIEANLARVYRKLGISSRAELGAAMARREQAPIS